VTPGLYLHALRVARWRQLRARMRRPFARRRFPGDAPPRGVHSVPAVEALWRSPAFEPGLQPDPATRLGGFHAEYGEDVLAATRAGDADGARALVESWIDDHPPRNDDAWHPYPLSTRVGNWIAALTLAPELASPRLSKSLWLQLRRLEANVEDDILGNHVIRNARALVLGGAAFDVPALTRRGIDLLRRELPEQVLRDGGHYERSPVYHLVVLRDLLEVQAASPHSWLGEAIDRMRVFAAALTRPDGEPALFNDGGLEQAPKLELPDPPDGLVVFEDAGFAVVREGSLWFAFRCGPAAPQFLPAHAHADALSFQLWWNGREVFADAGTYTYEPGPERDWFRGTAAHATIRVDGHDQFRLWGAFRSGRLPAVKLHFAREGIVEATVHLGRRVRHVRKLEWSGSDVVVHDRLEGSGSHRIESRLLWAPGAAERAELAVYGEGERRDERAWVSERFGEKVETRATTVFTTRKLPTDLGFRIRCLE
jgi:Heparinase II/III-like protein/Heparinase II/III N-terminus